MYFKIFSKASYRPQIFFPFLLFDAVTHTLPKISETQWDNGVHGGRQLPQEVCE